MTVVDQHDAALLSMRDKGKPIQRIINIGDRPSAPIQEVIDYFWTVHRFGMAYLDGLPDHVGDDPVIFAENVVFPELQQRMQSQIMKFPRVSFQLQIDPLIHNTAQGLNTIGWLVDRLSILSVKEWQIAHRIKDQIAADVLREDATAEIIKAISMALPGKTQGEIKVTRYQDKTRGCPR